MGVMIPMKRERMLTIRVTDDEHARLLERCEGKQLAVWMRRVCLSEPVARFGRLHQKEWHRVTELGTHLLNERTEHLSQLYSENWK